MARPTYVLQVAFASNPDDALAGATWTDITAYLDVKAGVKITRGRTDEFSQVQPSTMSLTLKNTDGRFTKGYASSPYYPNVVTGKRIRLGLVWSAVTYWRFTGDVDEWPTDWDGSPQYAECKLKATDRFKRLSDLGEYQSTLIEDTLDDSPFAYYPLQEPVGALSAGDISGNDEAPMVGVQAGTGGSIALGDTTSQTSYYDRTTVSVLFTPAGAGDGRHLFAKLRKPAVGAAGASIVAYAQEGISAPTTGPVATLSADNGTFLSIWKTGTGNIGGAYFDGPTGTLYEVASGFGMSNVFPMSLSVVLDIPSAGNGRVTFYYAGTAYGVPVVFPMASVPKWTRAEVGGTRKLTFKGTVNHVSFYSAPISSAAIVGQSQGQFNGRDGAGNTTYSRLAKLCVYSNLGTLQWSSSGAGFVPQSIGGQQIAGQPLSAMRLLETTEDGVFFIRGDGQPMFQLRPFRFNLGVTMTLDAGKVSPEIRFRGDDFGLANDVTASRPEGAVARVVNAVSIAASGRRKASVDAIPATDEQLRALAAWRANWGGNDRSRITGVKISLLNDPSLIPAALGMDLSGKLALTGLPTQAPTASLELYAEGWDEVISEDEWSLDYTTSPGQVGDVWKIGVAGHNEIGVTTRIPY